MITAKEIAKLCGVSPSTVSNILNGKPNVSDETRKRVLEVVEATNYRPNYFAASIRSQTPRMICIIGEDLGQFVTMPVVLSIMSACEDRGYRTIVQNMRMYERYSDTWYEDEDLLRSRLGEALSEAEGINPAGVIYVAGHDRVIRCFPEDYDRPTVVAYAESARGRFPSILLDDEKGGYDMGRHLLSMGHRRIGIISGARDNRHAIKRLAGYRRALAEEAMVLDEDLIVYGRWQRESGYDLAPELLKKKVTAIWCMNDQMAGGVYDRLREMGIAIGDGMSVAGFDEASFCAYIYPKLCTCSLPLADIGWHAADTVIKMIEKPGFKPDKMMQLIPCRMVPAASVQKNAEA